MIKGERAIRMKKSWGKPIIQVQLFAPQEYCVNCSPVANESSWQNLINRAESDYYYIDFNKNSRYDNGERFLKTSGASADGVMNKEAYSSVTVYTRINSRTGQYSTENYIRWVLIVPIPVQSYFSLNTVKVVNGIAKNIS